MNPLDDERDDSGRVDSGDAGTEGSYEVSDEASVVLYIVGLGAWSPVFKCQLRPSLKQAAGAAKLAPLVPDRRAGQREAQAAHDLVRYHLVAQQVA